MNTFGAVCIVYHSMIADAPKLGDDIMAQHSHSHDWWAATEATITHDASKFRLPETDLIVAIGGDGTIMRAVHAASPHDIPVLGVNMGRVGFMSEIDASESLGKIGWYLDGNGHIDYRTMLKTTLNADESRSIYALNDVTIFRGRELRVIEVSAKIDDIDLCTYRGDGVIVSTATGSTGYSLQLGGPVIDPGLSAYILKPIAAHMSQFGGVILDSTRTLRLTLETWASPQLTVDGFISQTIRQGDRIRIAPGDRRASFLRREPRNSFWKGLSNRLGMRIGAAARITGS